GRLKQWLNRFNGVATKNLPNYLGWRRALEAWGDQVTPQSWIKGAIGNRPYQ
ncbi:MAG TPA: IS1595 family transposase, partial [Roseiarcus sp.]